MFQAFKRPRIYSIGVHGIQRVVVERDARYKETRIKLVGGDEDYDFTVTVFTDKEDLPDVNIVDVPHVLDSGETAPVTALPKLEAIQETIRLPSMVEFLSDKDLDYDLKHGE